MPNEKYRPTGRNIFYGLGGLALGVLGTTVYQATSSRAPTMPQRPSQEAIVQVDPNAVRIGVYDKAAENQRNYWIWNPKSEVPLARLGINDEGRLDGRVHRFESLIETTSKKGEKTSQVLTELIAYELERPAPITTLPGSPALKEE